MHPSGDGSAQPAEKLMSISTVEFLTSLGRLTGGQHQTDPASGCASADIELGMGTASVRFEPVTGVRLGGLLELPRARVTISFSDEVTPAERSAFQRRFELAFQRGGG